MKLKRIFISIILIVILTGMVFTGWALVVAQAMPEALAALESSPKALVEQNTWTVFRPLDKQPVSGFIFYPGGRVDWRAYAPAAQKIANCGGLVVIVPMPLNLAVFGKDRAKDVIKAFPEIKSWVMGGHSLGGAMAAQYVYDHANQIKGLVLWAAYPASSSSLADRPVKVLSISASQDGLATPDKIAASHKLLPLDAHWLTIDGGNHAYFGWYGPQPGDKEAVISRERQQEIVVEATCAFVNQVWN
jgi:hypothetical protein